MQKQQVTRFPLASAETLLIFFSILCRDTEIRERVLGAYLADLEETYGDRRMRLSLLRAGVHEMLSIFWSANCQLAYPVNLVFLSLFSVGLLPATSTFLEAALFAALGSVALRKTQKYFIYNTLQKNSFALLGIYFSLALSQWLNMGSFQNTNLGLYALSIPALIIGGSSIIQCITSINSRFPADRAQKRIIVASAAVHILAVLELARVQLAANDGPLSIANESLSAVKGALEICGAFVAAYGLFEISKLASPTSEKKVT